MTIKEQLRANFPKTVNRAAPVFSAMVANDGGDAAIEYELANLEAFIREWTGTPGVYDQSGEMLEKTVSFLSFLERFTDESDVSIKNRLGAIFVRRHDDIWGTPYDIKSVFEQYFPSAEIFLVENTNDVNTENLIADGDFSEDSRRWNYVGCRRDTEARFSKSYGVGLYRGSSLRQTVSLANMEDKAYFLHFFVKGSVGVRIRSDSGKYWDDVGKKWTDDYSSAEFMAEGWQDRGLYFIASPDMTDIEFEFYGNDDGMSCIDYIRLFEKKEWPSFSVIAHFEAEDGSNALKLAPGKGDPDGMIADYGGYDYYDQSFLTGVAAGFAQDIYNDLLDLVRSQGVRAYLDIVIKDYIEEDQS